MLNVPIQQLAHGLDLPLPSYATCGAAGMDLFAAISADIILGTGQRLVIPCGFALALPLGCEAQIRSRSGLALTSGIICLNAPGTIDSDYRGEVKVLLMNQGDEDFTVLPKMRIAQMVIGRYEQVQWEESSDLPSSERQASGFGSTGL